ncbi:MAG: thiol:disulfide interchange protein DsbA/DsbL [Betaproteobacteria bacterium]|nr:thiol:disulfide interchange protein DsbA/DsbL [Betaproteobacteria bacterium]
MNKLTKSLLVAAALFISGAAFAAVEPGRDYQLLNPSQPTGTKKIEVLEFFFYGCSHCFNLHPLLSAWEKTMPKDVEMTLVPTIFRDSSEPMARTYYALESLGQRQHLHDALYRAWNVEKLDINDEAKISDFVAKHGVDRARFSAAYNSFSIQSKVARARQMIRSYGINGTPTLVVDGKYLITDLQPADTVRVLSEVIAMARKAHTR